MKTIWSFKKITELNGATGIVACEKTLADKLIADGHAQDLNIGGNHLKHIEKADIVSVYDAPKKKSAKQKSSEGDK